MPRGGGRSSGGSRSSGFGGFGRSGSGSGRSSSPFRSRTAASPPRPTPQPAATHPPQSSGGIFGGQGLGATVAQGAAFGVGSGLGHAAVNSFMGSGRSSSGESSGGQVAQAPTDQASAPQYYEEAKEQAYESPCVSFNNMFLK